MVKNNLIELELNQLKRLVKLFEIEKNPNYDKIYRLIEIEKNKELETEVHWKIKG